MSDRSPNTRLEKNLENMLKATFGASNPVFQETLTRDVLQAVRQQGRREPKSIRVKRALVGLARQVVLPHLQTRRRGGPC